MTRVVAGVPQPDFAPFVLVESSADPRLENGNTAGGVNPDGVNLVVDQAEATGDGRVLTHFRCCTGLTLYGSGLSPSVVASAHQNGMPPVSCVAASSAATACD